MQTTKRKVTLNKWESPNGKIRVYVNNAFPEKTLYFYEGNDGSLQFELKGRFPDEQAYNAACNRVRSFAAKYNNSWGTLLLACEQQEEARKDALQTGIDVTGNSYPVRLELHRMGCTWDTGRKVWVCPQDVAEEAQALVDEQPEKKSPKQSGGKSYGTCSGCGAYKKLGASGMCSDCYYSSSENKAPF